MGVKYTMRFPMRLDKTGKVARAATQYERDMSRITFALGTSVGERVMWPAYGANVKEAWYMSGQQQDIATVITDAVSEVFRKHLSPLLLMAVTVTPNEDGSIQVAEIEWRNPETDHAETSVGKVNVAGPVSQVTEDQ